MSEEKSLQIQIGQDNLILKTGVLARQANASVWAQMGDTVVLATVCAGSKVMEDIDFVPLSVEYNEKYYAAGKVPGGFLKREGRPKDREILVSRLIDRPIRPLFSKDFKREIQVVPTVMSAERNFPADIIAMVASFCSVYLSDIPFEGPVGAVRVIYKDGQYQVNPGLDQIANSDLEIVVAGGEQGITMVEGGANQVSEQVLLDAIDYAHHYIKIICQAQRQLLDLLPKKEKLPLVTPLELPVDLVREKYYSSLQEITFIRDKKERTQAFQALVSEAVEQLSSEYEEPVLKKIGKIMDDFQSQIMRESILTKQHRIDGRNCEQIRPITCDRALLPRTHGSALFTRGETQALANITLGTLEDSQILDDIDGDVRNNFMLHYNFPPFSTGETGRLGTSRREVGHGYLARRSLLGVLPESEKFPYVLRVVSEVLESNGSSSMATVCSSSLALFDAGVPIKSAVAGIAMGLIYEDENNYAILSDILGDEDHLGDMDFKVAGTEKGITGFQMDIKIQSISPALMKKAVEQAKQGRLHILNIMNQTLSVPEKNISSYALKVVRLDIDPEKIGAVIGAGGKNIKALTENYGVEINIEDNGHVHVYGKVQEDLDSVLEKIKLTVEDVALDKEYDGIVKKITDFGAFIEVLPGKEGLCHISKLGSRVAKVSDVLRQGQSVRVKVINMDKSGKFSLSLTKTLD